MGATEVSIATLARPAQTESVSRVDWTSVGMGWLPDWPSLRDFTPETVEIASGLERLGIREGQAPALPPAVDLRGYFPPADDQGPLGASTAFAAASLIEYSERRANGADLEFSRRFVYKTTRALLGWMGDTGAFLRATLAALQMFGAPPAEKWPYDVVEFDAEPPAFCYAFADIGVYRRPLRYYRLDPPDGGRKDVLLLRAKSHLAAGLPFVFGISVVGSMAYARESGRIPMPAGGERLIGGQALVALGYDDSARVGNPLDGRSTTGALLVRNSWGGTWGERGCGWLPYDYVLSGLAVDCWSVFMDSWIDTGQFGL